MPLRLAALALPVLALPVLSLLVPVAARADAIADRVAQMPGEVEEVRMVGEWSDAGEAGAYRIVVVRAGLTEVRSRLFVQWVLFGEAGTRVKATTEIEELAELGADIKETTVETDDGKLVLTMELGGGDKVEGTYEAIVSGPGDYRFQKAGN